tara:strand:- start:159 stop:512 length:354 start_codon:yes stop_codon:yes gene_type:complete
MTYILSERDVGGMASEYDEDEPLIWDEETVEETTSTGGGTRGEGQGTPVKRQANIDTDRVARPAYYGILESDDSDLRASYMIREREAYMDQLTEDERLDAWWSERLATLVPDDVIYE